MKFISLLCVVLSVVGLGSCSNDDDGFRENISILKVFNDDFNGALKFEDIQGIEMIPTRPMVEAASSDLAYVHYRYNVNDIHEGIESVDVDVLSSPFYIPELTYDFWYPELEKQKHYNLADILEEESSLWGNEYIILNMVYYLNNATTEQNLTEELKNHEVFIYFNPEEVTENGTLRLYLRYNIVADMADDKLPMEYTRTFSEVKYINVENIVSEYKLMTGKKPSKIEVLYFTSSKASVVSDKIRPESIVFDYSSVE